MSQTIDQYFLEKASNLTFIELKKDYSVEGKFVISANTPIPLVIDDLVEGIKDKSMLEKIGLIKMIDGMLYTIGVDSKNPYSEIYKDWLYSYDSNIENYTWSKGIKMVENGQSDDGMIYLRAATELVPAKPNLIYTLAFSYEEEAKKYLKNKEIEIANMFVVEATRLYEEILNIDEQFSLAYYKLGFHYYQNKLFIKAQLMWQKYVMLSTNEDLKEEIEVNLRNIQEEVNYEIGYTSILSGKVEEGLEYLLPLEDKHNDWWNLHFMIGLGYRQLGVFQKAIEKFERVLMLKPHQIDAINELGLCYASLGQNMHAIEQFDRILQTETENAEVLCNRGAAYLQMKEYRRARADFEQANEINPEDQIAIACLKELERIMTQS